MLASTKSSWWVGRKDAIITARADLWWLILVLSIIPLGDALVVLTNGGRKSAAFGIHGATAAAMVIAALLLERS
jgi:hypothetical protein